MRCCWRNIHNTQYLVLMQTNALVHKEALLPQKAWTIIQIASLDGTSSSAFSLIDGFKVSYVLSNRDRFATGIFISLKYGAEFTESKLITMKTISKL